MTQTSIVVMGAKGRMGATLVRLVQNDPELTLAGVVEQKANQAGLEHLGCPISEDPAAVLAKAEGAVVIDFTAPAVTVSVAQTAADTGNPMVIGTTGLSEVQQEELAVAATRTPLFWAPNMSVGVNVLLELLPQLVRMLGDLYDVELSEIHHKFKKDAPSGTALKLAQVLAEAKGWDLKQVAQYCREGIIGERPKDEIGVQTLRGGDVVGDHTVYFFGPGERIEVTHRAHSRETFAQGALRAAKWIGRQKPGTIYSMADMVLS
ncbi:MAG: 4-hydroxy-tetrahydrodipicolinate reductase [Thermodesulfobacteriota bacterium]